MPLPTPEQPGAHSPSALCEAARQQATTDAANAAGVPDARDAAGVPDARDAAAATGAAYVPYVPPPQRGPRALMRPLSPLAPFRWLAAGWRDLLAHPGIALFYGVCFWLMALILMAVFRNKPEYTVSMASGCLLVGPFLAMGLYEVSRRREAGLQPELGVSLTCWDAHTRSMGMLVLVLIVLELLWGRASLVVFAVFFNTGMPSTTGVIRAIFNPENWEFVTVYLAVGGVFAALVFSTAVVSIPMILDRDTDAVSAALTSMRVVFANPGVLFIWGVLITLLVGLAFVPWGLGLVLIGPLLGHASWHAYRGSVRWQEAAAELPEVAQAPEIATTAESPSGQVS